MRVRQSIHLIANIAVALVVGLQTDAVGEYHAPGRRSFSSGTYVAMAVLSTQEWELAPSAFRLLPAIHASDAGLTIVGSDVCFAAINQSSDLLACAAGASLLDLHCLLNV